LPRTRRSLHLRAHTPCDPGIPRDSLASYGRYAAQYDSDLFFTALDYCGVYGILVLFGLLPAAMAWTQRYGRDASPALSDDAMVPGGRGTLGAIAAVAASIIGLETLERLAGAAGAA